MTAVPAQGVPLVAARGAPGVPWTSVVLPLAALLAVADEFWVVALRTSVGAIERTSSPATSWLRESVELMPVYVLAVVAALGLAHRWWGARRREARVALATIVVVAVAATLAGTAILLVSAWYDHRLQVQALAHQAGTHLACVGDCLEAREAASWALQLRAAVVGSALLLVTNLVLVGWAVALRGRPIRPTVRRRGEARVGADDRLGLLALALLGSALVHAAVVPEHLRAWQTAGLFFVVVGVCQLAAAASVWRGAGPALLTCVAAGSAAVAALWLWSRTTGLPFGPEAGESEGLGLADLAATGLELVALGLCLSLLRSRRRQPGVRQWLRPHRRGVAVSGVVALAVLGVGGSALPGVALVPGTGVHAGGAGGVADVTGR